MLQEKRLSKLKSGANRSSYWVPILGSAIKILEVFYGADSDLTLHQVSAKAKVGKTSTFRILYTLDKVGYVEKDSDTGRYRLGVKIIAAARKALVGSNLVVVARPYMKKLRDEFDETVNLAVLQKGEIVYLEILESPHPFRMTDSIGARIPWHSTALGKCIAAFLPESRVRSVLKQSAFKRFTANTITSTREYMEVLTKVRHLGYSLDAEESELGATCIAAPIFACEDEVVGAVSLSGPTPRIQDKQNKVAHALKVVAAAISHSLEEGAGEPVEP
jgi:DNA-binding IclR family transcriptional regulator